MEESTSMANSSCDLWAPIIKTWNGPQEKAKARARKTRYSFSMKLLVKTQIMLFRWMAKRHASLDVWIGSSATLRHLEEGHRWKRGCQDPRAVSAYHSWLQSARSVQRRVRLQEFFAWVLCHCEGERSSLFYVCKASYRFVFYPHWKRRKWADIFTLDTIKLPRVSVFIVHCYMQQAGGEYLGWTRLR